MATSKFFTFVETDAIPNTNFGLIPYLNLEFTSREMPKASSAYPTASASNFDMSILEPTKESFPFKATFKKSPGNVVAAFAFKFNSIEKVFFSPPGNPIPSN